MGMSINESIEQIQLLKQLEDSLGNINGNTNTKVSQACTMAIEIMRKYQKIGQILNEDFKEYHPLDRNPYRLSLIREVLEDGNDSR